MYKVLTSLFFIFIVTFCYTQNNPPIIIAAGDLDYCPNTTSNIVSSISITDTDIADITLDLIRIQISEGYTNGSDQLFLSGTHPSITASWSSSEGILTLTGPASFTEFENAIENVFFETTQTVFTEDKSFSINIGSANYLPSTDHYYFYVADTGITWAEAEAAASVQDFYGLQGYLATITSQEESILAGEQSAGAGWVGATDTETENVWKWVTGPEAGTIFWIGEANGSPQNNEFSFWNNGEPNNFGGNESYAHITDPSIGTLGSWNDLPITGDQDPNSAFHPKGYLVEFGGLPGDPEINLSASTTIKTPRIEYASDLTFCGNETIRINTASNTDTILWYDSATATIPVFSGFIYEPSITNSTTYWITPVFNGCTSGERTQITITIKPQPMTSDIIVTACSNSMIPQTNFNLTSSESNISTNHNNETFEYYTTENDAITGNNEINDITNYSVNTMDEVWVKTISNENCFNISKITLEVNYTPNEPYEDTFYACDDFLDVDGNDTDMNSDTDGITFFDFSEALSEISTNLNVNVLFYETEDDRSRNLNEIQNTSNYRNKNIPNTLDNSFPIYYKLINISNNDCIGIGQIFLKVNSLPEFEVTTPLALCLSQIPLTITVGNPQETYTYEWKNENGDTIDNASISETGIYTVTAFKTENNTTCERTKTIEVVDFDAITINEEDNIEIIDDTNSSQNNLSIHINRDNTIGDYEFALQDESGEFITDFQTETSFTNLEGGVYTLVTRHINQCTPDVEIPLSLIQFPKFFTPNGDSYNDLWTIKGVNESFYPESSIHIFNRFGVLVGKTTIPENGWNGTYNGKQLPPDDYWYKITLIPPSDSSRKTIIKSGHFSLLRK